MPGVIPFIPLIAAGVGLAASNSGNKAAAASQDQHYQQAQGDTAGAGTTARSQLDALFAAHPNPISSAQPIVGPQRVGGGSVGGGTLGVNGAPVGAQPQPGSGIPPGLLQALLALLQQQHAGQGPARQTGAGFGEKRSTNVPPGPAAGPPSIAPPAPFLPPGQPAPWANPRSTVPNVDGSSDSDFLFRTGRLAMDR